MARLEKPSMELKMPGMIAQGDFQPSLALIQKHRGQESGRARMPRFLAEIRCIKDGVLPLCIGVNDPYGSKIGLSVRRRGLGPLAWCDWWKGLWAGECKGMILI